MASSHRPTGIWTPLHRTRRDQSELDIARAEARAPQLKGRIRKALLPLGPWPGDGKTTSRTMPISGVPLPKK